MTSDARRSNRLIQPLDFRKRVQWFLAALVGFLVVVILFLLMFMQGVMAEAALERREEQGRILAFVQSELGSNGTLSAGEIDRLRRNLGVVAIRVERPDRTAVTSGSPDPAAVGRSQTLGSQTLTVWFREDPLQATRKRFALVAIISIGATIIGTLLLLLFLPRVVGPVETMLRDASGLGDRDHGVTDERYLIDTFRASIARLKSQETELRDLHEREKARADDLERLSRLLTRSIASGFVSLDSSGRVVEINEAATRILEIDIPPLPAPLEEVFPSGEFRETVSRSLDSGEPVSRQELRDHSTGAVIGLTTVPLRNEEDEMVGLLVLFTDLSELRALERRVSDLRFLADLGEVAAGIAHEFRNSLGTILGYLRMALRSDLGAEPGRRLSLAEREGQRMAETINALLAFTKPIEPVSEPVDLLSVAEETIERVDDRIQLRADEDVWAAGDRSLIESVIENLLRNAIEAVDGVEDPEVEVSVLVEGERIRIDVADNGPGIPPGVRSRLYLPFKSGRPEGTGMGLALARKIALSLGGSLDHLDRPEGGTIARLVLPAAETPPQT